METVSNYYHGEEGEVVDSNWICGKSRLIYWMQLRGNPHRAFVSMHTRSDISIDPLLRPGDKTVFVRLGQYSAIWVKKGDEFYPKLEQVIERSRESIRVLNKYRNIASYSRFLAMLYGLMVAARTRIPVRLREPVEKPSTLPTTPLTVFLSYSNKNVLLAHEFYNNLKQKAKVDVWLDLTRQRAESPEQDQDIASWLQRAIDSSQVFMVLLTKESVASEWVRNEIVWATEKAQREHNFHLILVKLGKAQIPDFARNAKYIFDSESLSYHEIVEELFAAVYQRRGRREWLEEQRKLGWPEAEREQKGYFHPPLTNSGRALSLDWIRKGETIHWTLEYEKDGRKTRIKGSGESEIVDLDIRPGDKIGFLQETKYFQSRIGIYMRSGDPSLSPHDVFQSYIRQLPRRSWDEVPRPLAARISNLLLFSCGLLVIALTEYFYISYFVKDLSTIEPPSWIEARHFTIVATIINLEFAAYMLIRGLYQVIYYARPFEFGDRSGKTALRYSVKALSYLGITLIFDSILNIFIFVAFYVLTVGIIIQLFHTVFGGDPALAFSYGAAIGYGLYVVDEVFPLWDLIKEE